MEPEQPIPRSYKLYKAMTYLIGLVLLFYLLNNVIVPSFAKIGQIKNQSTLLEPFTNLTVTLNQTHGLNSLLKANLFTSFDEVVVVLFVGSAGQKTLPWQMFTGLREQISPTILAVATILIAVSVVLLIVVEILRRRSERLRGLSPAQV